MDEFFTGSLTSRSRTSLTRNVFYNRMGYLNEKKRTYGLEELLDQFGHPVMFVTEIFRVVDQAQVGVDDLEQGQCLLLHFTGIFVCSQEGDVEGHGMGQAVHKISDIFNGDVSRQWSWRFDQRTPQRRLSRG